MKDAKTNRSGESPPTLSADARQRWKESGLADMLAPMLMLVGRLVMRRLDLALADAGLGLTPAQARTVATLWLHGPMSQQSLATHTEVEPSTLVRTLDVMEREGIARRGSDPEDRRAHLVRLTARGEELVPRLVALWETVERELREDFDDEELGRIRELVSRTISKLATGETPCCG